MRCGVTVTGSNQGDWERLLAEAASCCGKQPVVVGASFAGAAETVESSGGIWPPTPETSCCSS